MIQPNYTPFELRPFACISLPPWTLGVIFGAALFVISSMLFSISGVAFFTGDLEAGLDISAQTHVALLCSVMIGYGLAVTLGLYRSQRGEHEANKRADDRTVQGLGNFGSSYVAGGLGLLAGVLVIFLTVREILLQEPLRNPWNAGELSVDVMSLLLFWGIGRAAYFTLRGAGAAGRDTAEIDLFNLTPLFRYGDYGLRTALAWTVGISIVVMLMMLDPNPNLQIGAVWVLGPALLGSTIVGSVALFLPLWQLRLRIRSAKESALENVLQELRRIRGAASTAPGTEADLLARRAYLVDVRDWPIDVGTLRRFGFYLLFPAGSWLIGTTVKRLLDTVVLERIVRMVRMAFEI